MRILPEIGVCFHKCLGVCSVCLSAEGHVFHDVDDRCSTGDICPARDWRDEPKENDDRVADELIKGNCMIDCPVNIGVTSNCSQRPG